MLQHDLKSPASCAAPRKRNSSKRHFRASLLSLMGISKGKTQNANPKDANARSGGGRPTEGSQCVDPAVTSHPIAVAHSQGRTDEADAAENCTEDAVCDESDEVEISDEELWHQAMLTACYIEQLADHNSEQGAYQGGSTL